VVLTAFVLFLLLIIVIVMGIEDYGPKIWTALGGRVVPPPDRSLAGAKPTLLGIPARCSVAMPIRRMPSGPASRGGHWLCCISTPRDRRRAATSA
jgi:hypothetical protein